MFWFGVSAAIIVGIFIVIGLISWILKWYRKVEQGHALIINKKKDLIVTFNGGLVIPIIQKGEMMDISVKTIEIDRRAKNGLICKDDIRADITVAFYVRVNETAEDVIQVAKMVGCHRASDQDVLEQLFNAKFSEALKTVGKRFEFTELYDNREKFNTEIKKTIGRDLNGYRLDDVAIDYLEQTPIENLDKDNILDAEGIRKITEITTEKNIRTNERKRVEDEEIKRRDVEAAEKIFEQERIEKEAEAKKDREIATAQAREDAQTKMVQAEELLKAGTSQKKTEEELAIIEQNKQRQIAISEKNKEQAIAVEAERVEKARQLCSRFARALNVQTRVRFGPSLAAASLAGFPSTSSGQV